MEQEAIIGGGDDLLAPLLLLPPKMLLNRRPLEMEAVLGGILAEEKVPVGAETLELALVMVLTQPPPRIIPRLLEVLLRAEPRIRAPSLRQLHPPCL